MTTPIPVQLTFFEVTGDYFAIADPSITGVLNSPIVAPINGLVTFTARLGGKGRMLPVNNYLVQAAYNAEQTVYLIGNPTGGSFTLQYGTDPPVTIAWNASASAVQSALAASPSIGVGNVAVVADALPQAYDVQFTGALGHSSIPILTADGSGLSNAEGLGFCEVTVTQTSQGGPQIVADTAIALAPLTAGIFNGQVCAIDRDDTPGIELVSNIAELQVGGDLIYDVSFSSITFNGANQILAPFAFTAPTDATPVVLTDPALTRLPWQPPAQNMYTPAGGGALQLARPNWRSRAGIF